MSKSRPLLHRAFTMLVATMMLTAVVAPAAFSGTASAEESAPPCDEFDLSSWFLTGCTVDSYNESAHQMSSHDDIYGHLSTEEQSLENFMIVFDNYRQDLDGRAWMIAEATTAEEYENGSTENEAQLAAEKEVADYYATKQKNALERWETHMAALNYSLQRADDNNITRSDVVRAQMYVENTSFGDSNKKYYDYTSQIVGFKEVEVTLADGSTYNTTGLRIHPDIRYSGDNIYYDNSIPTVTVTPFDMYLGNYQNNAGDGNADLHMGQINVRSSTGSQFAYMFPGEWSGVSAINSQEESTQTQVDNFINATYEDFQTGDINSTDVISRITMMEEYGLQGTGPNSTFKETAAALAAMGLDHPDLSESGFMNVTFEAEKNGYTYDNRKGMLFARNAPSGGWSANGTQYNTENVTGPVMFVSEDGVEYQIKGNFTIHSAVDSQGNEVENVTTKDTDYDVANSTQLQTLLDELATRQDTLEVYTYEEDSTTSSGGTTSSGWSPTQNQKYVIVAVVAFMAIAGFRGGKT